MKNPLPALAALACAAFLAAACGKGDDVPVPKVVAPSSTAGQAPAPSDVPQVAPNVPKAAEAPTPTPGQANDHSSPGFKSGGKNDPSK